MEMPNEFGESATARGLARQKALRDYFIFLLHAAQQRRVSAPRRRTSRWASVQRNAILD